MQLKIEVPFFQSSHYQPNVVRYFCGEVGGKRGDTYISGGRVNCYHIWGNHLETLLNKNIDTFAQEIPLQGLLPTEIKAQEDNDIM